MGRLFGLFYGIAATTLGGSSLVVVLVAGFVTWQAIVGALALGAAAAAPVAWGLARRLSRPRRGP